MPQSTRSGSFAFTVALAFLSVAAANAPAQEPLHVRIDRLIEADPVGPLAPPAGDHEFLRRVWLDLNGTLPGAAEARAFLENPSPGKREALVDRLLASPRYALHMATVFDVMLMERRPDKHVPAAEWQAYLRQSFEQNKPYNQLAREILGADGTDPALRPAAKFLLDRGAEPNLVTRDLGRVFFGMDLQCAQCHDHPLIGDYLQADYHGLLAFVGRTIVFTDAQQKKAFLAERAEGSVDFKSVFTGEVGRTRPQLPGGAEINEPRFRLGEQYAVPPADDVRPVPKFSRRVRLAELATDGTNRSFNVNIVNRLWAHMLGRGLVDPLDLHHSANPPSHPVVLDLLASEFVATKYDIRRLLREIALTRAYQRSIELPAESLPAAALPERLAAAQAESERVAAAAAASLQATLQAEEEVKSARAALAPVEAELNAADDAVAAAKKPHDEAAAALAATQGQATAKQGTLTTVTEAHAKAAEAAAKLPGDAEVAQAVATFQARVQTLTTEIAALQQTAATQTAALQPLKAKLDETHAAADAVHARLLEARKPLDAVQARLAAARNQSKSEETATGAAKARLAALKSLADHGTLLATAKSSEDTVAQVNAELTAARQAVEAQAAEVTRRAALIGDAEKASGEAAAALEALKQQVVAKQALVTTVADAAAKAEAALQQLPGDPDLTAAIEKLKTRHVPLAKELVELQAVLPPRESAANEAAARLTSAQQAAATATSEMTAKQQAAEAATARFAQVTEKAAADRAAVAESVAKLTETWTARAAVAGLKPLSPEQMAWSVLQATGHVDVQRAAADAELEQTVPKTSVAGDPAKQAARDAQLELAVQEKLKGNLPAFVTLYGAAAGQPQDAFFATADQALFFANGDAIRAWLAPGGGNLTERLIATADPAALADELYLSVLTRRPTPAEVAEVTQYLTTRPQERPAAVQELAWALLTSAEFRFNH